MDTPEPHPWHDQAQHVQQEIEKLVALLAQAAPDHRMTTASALRSTCDQLLATALINGMADARKDGWGLRRIAAASRYSHEQVRTLLARTTPVDAQAPPQTQYAP